MTAAFAPPARELPLTLQAHDREQIELQLSQALAPADPKRVLSVELYFYVPRNIGLSADNYPREEFYADLTTFARVDLPRMSLEELAGELPAPSAPSLLASRSPLIALAGLADAVGRGEPPKGPAAVEVKLFGHLFTEAVRDAVAGFSSSMSALASGSTGLPTDGGAPWVLLDEIDRFAGAARAALGALRRARRRFDPLSRAAPIMETLRITDEYCSLFLDGALAIMARDARSHPALFDGTGFVGRLQQTLGRHALAEARYRTDSGYLNLGAADGGTEYFAYRQSLLKKAVQQALYVDTRRLQHDTFVRNTTGAVAAGLAATWALVAQLPSQIGDLAPATQTALLALPVLAYMAKDRIKELTREWMLRRLKGYDNDVAIEAGSLADAGLGHLAGRVRERATFLPPSEVPRDVHALRVARRTVRTADPGGESVLHYRRTVEIEVAKGASPPAPGLALRQIIRLNLRHFLVRMDDPRQQESHYLPGEARFVTLPLPKVYHVNLIARVTATDAPSTLTRWRIVVDKEGIVRLDEVGGPAPAEFAAGA